jgi:hypothetical protein
MNVPRFTAEASIYKTRHYRGMQVHGVSGACEVVTALRCFEEGCYYGHPWCGCFCDWNGNCHCACTPEPSFPIPDPMSLNVGDRRFV